MFICEIAFLIAYPLSFMLVIVMFKLKFVLKCASQVNNLMCVEKFSDFPQLGRFTLRTEGDKVFPFLGGFHIYLILCCLYS